MRVRSKNGRGRSRLGRRPNLRRGGRARFTIRGPRRLLFGRRGPEPKYLDTATPQYLNSVSLTGGALPGNQDSSIFTVPALAGRINGDQVTDIPGGSGVSQRIGNRVQIKSLRFSGILTACRFSGALLNINQYRGAADDNGLMGEQSSAVLDGGGAPDAGTKFVRTSFRLMIVRDSGVSTSLGSPPAPLLSALQDIITPGGGWSWNTGFLNLSTLGRYEMLTDRTIICDNDDPQKQVVFTVPVNKTCRFGSGSSTDFREGAIYVFLVAQVEDANAVVLPPSVYPGMNANVRIKYMDV